MGRLDDSTRVNSTGQQFWESHHVESLIHEIEQSPVASP
jgi:hypothetical protein